MRILAHLHKFLPHHRGGAEHHALEVLRYFADQGHGVVAAVRTVPGDYTIHGIRVMSTRDRLDELQALYRWCDVAITHLDVTRGARLEAAKAGKPLVHLVHNERTLRAQGVKRDGAALIAYNSEWLRRQVEDVEGDKLFADRSMVVRPRVRCKDYEVTSSRECLTLINLSENKGADTFWELARLMPERRFLGVEGSYTEPVSRDRGQIMPPDLPNVEVVPTGDVVPVYARTDVLLMPSHYESWGRTALEAAASAIPVIAHPTPGLMEAMGASALYAPRLVPEAWVNWLLRLDEPGFRQMMSDAAWEHARLQERVARDDLEALSARLEEL